MDRPDAHPGRDLSADELAAALGARCRFPAPGAAVVCGVSGGADSLALLVLAVRAGCRATAVHVDHGLRAGSAAEADVVAGVAARLGARFEARRVAVAPGPDLEARARHARHLALGPDALLGHTADDQAETVLWNLLRGAGLLGAAAMLDDGRRPLLALRRAETRALCAALGLPVLDDPMNADPAYTRVRVRHELVPLASQIARRDVVPLLARHASLAAEAVAALDAATAALDAADTAALRAVPEPLAAWALRRWLAEQTGAQPVSAAGVVRVLAVVRGEVRAAEVDGGWRVERSRGRLRAVPPPARR